MTLPITSHCVILLFITSHCGTLRCITDETLRPAQKRRSSRDANDEEDEEGEEEGEGEEGEATLVADSKLYDTEEDENAKSEPGSSGINAFITAFM